MLKVLLGSKLRKHDLDMSGIKGKFSQKISFIRDIILNCVPVKCIKKIYLFGSYADGNPDESSDIDICVLLNKKFKNDYRDIRFKINHEFIEQKIFPSDVLIYMEDYFLKQNSCSTLRKEIIKKGKVMYG
jgi:predicted nucleotidyltransferase